MLSDKWNLPHQVEKSYFPTWYSTHTKLKCYVVIELKVVDFMPEFVGKLNFYVAAADELFKRGREYPSHWYSAMQRQRFICC